MSFIGKSINELINTEFACQCGKNHIANIETIAIGKGAIKQLESIIDGQVLKNGEIFNQSKDTIFVVSDVNTHKVAGKMVFDQLKTQGYLVKEYVYPHGSMHAEDKYVDEMREHLPEDTQLIIAVGSGSLNDITRYVAFHAGVPYYIIATAPSMDGYASNVSPLIHNDLKITYTAECAAAIIGDADILATAPMVMIAAGLGDVIGKYLAIFDWKLSSIISGEYYCDAVGDLVLYSVKKCVDNIEGMKRRDPEAMEYLMESLVLIGIAMSYIGFSRPASSSEHHIAHFLEMKSIFAGEYGELHGTNVGMATCLIGEMYRQFAEMPINYEEARKHALAFNKMAWEEEIHRTFLSGAEEVIKLYETAQQNNPEDVLRRIDAIEENEAAIMEMIREVSIKLDECPQMLLSLEGLVNPSGYPLTKGEVQDVLTYAKELRNRYGSLQFFYDLGVLEGLSDKIARKYMK
ncbi:MAG: sn-glycerol-1-phosphate dehydrogenase [Eubacteriaceae bacterium]